MPAACGDLTELIEASMEAYYPGLGTALALGFFGSSHCLAMCGGISAALGISLGSDCAQQRRLALLLLSNAGRICSYTVMGALMGLAASSIGAYQSGMLALRLLAGLMLVLMGLYLAGLPASLAWLERAAAGALAPLRRWVGQRFAAHGAWRFWFTGLAWGWLPCGLVYSSLVWSASSASWFEAALRMAAFGLGTLPAVLASGLAAGSIARRLARGPWRALVGLAVLGFGIWTIAAALQHASPLAAGHQH